MKRQGLLIVALVFLASMGAVASTIGPCPTETTTSGGFSNYLTPGFECTIDDKTFSNFSYTGSGSLGLTANEIGVTPVDSGGEFGFNFTAAWNTFSGFSSDSLIGYTVTAGPGFEVTDAELTIAGFAAVGAAQVSVADNLSNGENLFVFFNSACKTTHTCVTSDATTFTGVKSLDVVKDIALSSGRRGSGALSFVSNTVSQAIPEPASLALMAAGLLGIGAVLRRKLRA